MPEFRGDVYATEPTLQFGLQAMSALLEHVAFGDGRAFRAEASQSPTSSDDWRSHFPSLASLSSTSRRGAAHTALHAHAWQKL
jgi:hypothetical protein